MKHFSAWVYLTSKYAELWPRGKAMQSSIALFTVDWMPNQQVIVGVCSRFVRTLFGRAAQSSGGLNSAVNQEAVTCNWQTGLMSSICGKESLPMHCAMPAYFSLQSIIKPPLQFIFIQCINLRVMIWQFIFMMLQLTDLRSDRWYYIRWFDIISQ